MEWKNSVQSIILVLCLMVFISEISSFPTPEDYEQHEQEGMQEILEEIERQGGLTAPMVPRSYIYHTNPNHRMMRKSQRSNALRLRFGKRSAVVEDDGVFENEALGGGKSSNLIGHQLSSLKSSHGADGAGLTHQAVVGSIDEE